MLSLLHFLLNLICYSCTSHTPQDSAKLPRHLLPQVPSHTAARKRAHKTPLTILAHLLAPIMPCVLLLLRVAVAMSLRLGILRLRRILSCRRILLLAGGR